LNDFGIDTDPQKINRLAAEVQCLLQKIIKNNMRAQYSDQIERVNEALQSIGAQAISLLDGRPTHGAL
jgi:hypothetical protein